MAFNEKEYRKKYYLENKKKILEQNKKWHLKNRKKFKDYQKKWNKENKERRNEQNKKWRKENKEKNREMYKRYRKNNLKKIKEKDKKYREKNKERCIRKNLEWQKNNYERYRENQRKWYEKNKEYINEWQKKYLVKKRKANSKFKLDCNMAIAICGALKGRKHGRKWETLVGYNGQDLFHHLEKQFDNKMTWQNYGSYWHIDHIVPKSWFPYQTAEEQAFKDCWGLANLQPLEAIANCSKNNRFYD